MVFFILKFIGLSYLLFTVLWVFFFSIYWYCKIPHYRVQFKRKKPKSLFWHIYNTLPYDIAELIEDRFSNDFKEHGFILFSGKQGSGKTMAMSYYINRLDLKYPDVLIGTNYGYKNQDFVLDDYHQLWQINNGLNGTIFGFDEIQATFSSRTWKENFSPDLLACICQNRKSHRLIYGTCQNIQLVDKNIRLQCQKFAKCFTFFGFLTVVCFFIPEYDFEGNLDKSKFCGLRIFIQDKDLRSLYDTFDLIKSIKD